MNMRLHRVVPLLVLTLSSVLDILVFKSVVYAQAPSSFIPPGTKDPIHAPFLGIDVIGQSAAEDRRLSPQIPPGGTSPAVQVIADLRIHALEGKEYLQAKIVGTEKWSEEWMNVGLLVTLPAGTRIYTWAPNESIARWGQQGGVDEEEIKWLAANGSGAAGGGFYASLNPVDSLDYGDRLMEQRISAPVKMFNSNFGPFMENKVLNASELFQKMRDIGVVGFRYSETWMNWIDNPQKVLGNARIIESFASIAPTLLEIQKTRPDLVYNQYSNLISAIVRFSESMPEDFSFFKELAKFGFDLEKFKSGLPLPKIELPEGNPRNYKFALNRLLGEMSPYMEQRIGVFKSELSQALSAPFTEEKLSKVLSLRLPMPGITPFWGLGVAENGPAVVDELKLMAEVEHPIPKSIQDQFAPAPRWPVTSSKAPLQSAFPKRLASALKFIDLPDLILAMVDGKPKPWTLYDSSGDASSLSDRWAKSETELTAENLGMAPTAPLSITARLTKAASVFSEGKITGFRDRDIWAGGDLYPDLYGGYYRITESELKTLQENGLLTVRFKPDPDSRPEKPTVLARHRYLSVQDYKKVQTWLTPEFIAELAAAEASGVFRRPDLDPYKKLTTRFLETMVDAIFKPNQAELLSFIMTRRKIELATALRILVSIHPLDDFNGRSIRVVLGGLLNSPLFLPDWNDDLTAPLLTLSDRIEAGRAAVDFIEQGLLNAEAQNPIFPKYYDIPEWYQVLAGIPKISGDPAVFVAKIKAYLKKPETRELIRQKRYQELKFPGVCEQNLLPHR